MMTTLPIVEELVTRGHEIRIVSPIELKTSHPNLTIDILEGNDFNDEFSDLMMKNYNDYFALIDSFLMGEYTELIGADLLDRPLTKQLLKEGKRYDVVVANAVVSDLAVALSPLLAKHCMVMSAGPLPPWIPSPVHKPPSSIPTYLLPWESKMNFPRRVVNFAIHLTFKVLMKYDIWTRTDKLMRKYAPDAPAVADSWDNVALYMENSDPILVPSRPSAPNIVTYAAPHCHAAKPLHKEYVDIFEKAGDDGVIVFTLGSVIKANYMLPETINAFMSAFARLKQTVIWKFDNDSLEVPSNVILTRWIPQSDLLGHSKTRLLITHAGLLSLQEALFHGVPVIGIPFFADQPGNVARLKELGIGEILFFNNITADGVYNAVSTILNDQRYADNVKRFSAMFRDLPGRNSSAKRAADWIEYAIQHDGASHLRPTGEGLNFIQYFSIDIMLFMIVVVVLILFCVYKLLKIIIRVIFKQKIKTA